MTPERRRAMLRQLPGLIEEIESLESLYRSYRQAGADYSDRDHAGIGVSCLSRQRTARNALRDLGADPGALPVSLDLWEAFAEVPR